MQYVRSISGSVSKTWNSINPATLSGAIDVIVVEQEDGSLACSPFHIRFGKFSLLRPYEKKVEFKVNGQKQDYPMKLGEGGEAFFVFETSGSVPEALQTSPLVSPATSPELRPSRANTPSLQEPDPFELEGSQHAKLALSDSPSKRRGNSRSEGMPIPATTKAKSDVGHLTPLSRSPDKPDERPLSGDFSNFRLHSRPKLEHTTTDSALPAQKAALMKSLDHSQPLSTRPRSLQRPPSPLRTRTDTARSTSPPLVSKEEAVTRAINLSKKLWTSNIATQVTDSGDLMLDMTGYKSDTSEALQAEGIARKLLSEEFDGPYDIGSLIGADEKGNLWIYSSEEAKEAAGRKAAADGLGALNPGAYASSDAISDPGYHSDDARSDKSTDTYMGAHMRRDSDSAVGLPSNPSSPGQFTAGDPNRNYAKTLRLTSDQLKAMELKSGPNSMSFTVNRSTCTANLWYWKHDVPIVISDIDGTITKSDVLGHVLTTIGRDWTHQGVAKLYTDIAANGYNFLYLTSRSVGQADATRSYLKGVVQEGGFRLPNGPVILSPDRTIAALRREVYLRKPEIFKMACLRDIMALFAGHGGVNDTHASADAGLHTTLPGELGSGRGRAGSPFYAGFGNRLTDALSYRSVNIPSTRIFTINSNSEVILDLVSLNHYKTGYASMREIVDHFFPPVGLLVKGGGEEFTDYNYWRDKPLDIIDFTDSESEDEDELAAGALPSLKELERTETTKTQGSVLSEDEAGDEMLDSYLSDPRLSLEQSITEASLDDGEEVDLTSSMLEDAGDEDADADDEDEAVTPDLSAERQLSLTDPEATPTPNKPGGAKQSGHQSNGSTSSNNGKSPGKRKEMLDESDLSEDVD